MCRLNPGSISVVMSMHTKQWKRTPRAFIVLVGIFLIGLLVGIQYREMVANSESYITIYEVCSLVITSQALYAVVLYLYLVSDVPINSDVQDFIIARIGRTRFLIGEEFYLFISAVLFMILPWIGGILALCPNISFSSSWSEIGLMMLNVVIEPAVSPLVITLFSYMKGVMYCVVLGNVVIIGNTFFKDKYGFMLGIYLHGLFWAMTLDGIWGKWTLFSTALLSLNVCSDVITLSINLLLVLGSLFAARIVLRKRTKVGGSHD